MDSRYSVVLAIMVDPGAASRHLLPGDEEIRRRFKFVAREGQDQWGEGNNRVKWEAVRDESQFSSGIGDRYWEFEGIAGGIYGAAGLPAGIVPAVSLFLEGGDIEMVVCPFPAEGDGRLYDFEDWDRRTEDALRRHLAGGDAAKFRKQAATDKDSDEEKGGG